MSASFICRFISCAIVAVTFGCDNTYVPLRPRGSGGQDAAGGDTQGSGGSAGSEAGGETSIEVGGAPVTGGTGGGGGEQGGSGGASSSSAGAASNGGGSTTSGGASTSGTAGTANTAGSTSDVRWVGTWACGPQLTESGNMPPAPGLSGNTLRQIVYTSIGGSRLRVQLSNEFGNGPVTLNSVHIAKSTQTSSIDGTTDKLLTFSGTPAVTIPAGVVLFSDPLDFAFEAQTKLAITTYFGTVPTGITGHPGSRTTSYLQSGDAAAVANMTSPVTTDHWYYITAIDVVGDAETAAIVILGDSITDGRGSTTNANNRWPDVLSRRLRANAATAKVAVLNLGIGGNAVLSGGLGPTAKVRFARDVLGQRGVKWVVVLEGVNDLGYASSESVATDLIDAFGGFVTAAHAANLEIFGVPILPFGGSSYDSVLHESLRQTVNDWIRTSGKFDAVLDLDVAVRDPAAPNTLLGVNDSGDHLHLSPLGYQAMAGNIDLALFTQ